MPESELDGKVQARQYDQEIAQIIRQRRLDLGFTQAELATRVGTHYQHVQKWESGHSRLSGGWFVLVFDVLGLKPEDIHHPTDMSRKFRPINIDPKTRRHAEIIMNLPEKIKENIMELIVTLRSLPNNSSKY